MPYIPRARDITITYPKSICSPTSLFLRGSLALSLSNNDHLNDHYSFIQIFRFNSIPIKPDLPCSSSVNCWYCTRYCHCCSYFLINPANDPEFCCEECRILSKQDPSTVPPVIFSQAELEEILKSKNEPLIAFMKKVVSTESDQNTVLRIYLIRSDNSFEVIPLGTLLAICQIKTASTQVVVDCLLSKDFKPLKPVWYSKYCEEMIMSHCVLLQHEISYLSNKTSVTFS